jgi:hypothetical protein
MMRIRLGVTTTVAAGLLVLSALVSAQVPAVIAARHVRSAPIQVGRLVGAPLTNAVGSFSPLRGTPRGANLFGIVQNHMGALVPNAGVVIVRELLIGKVVGTTQVNDLAQFSIRALPPGLYTAELVGNSGAVIASTPAFSAAMGEVIQISQTIPVLPIQGFARAAASATNTALSAAASSGVMAVTEGAPVSPGK